MNNDERNERNGPTKTANNVESECHLAETETRNTAPKHAARQPTGNESVGERPRQADSAVLDLPLDNATNTVTEHFYRLEGFERSCDHCGREYQAKRSSSKYCSNACRQAAFKERRAAEYGRN